MAVEADAIALVLVGDATLPDDPNAKAVPDSPLPRKTETRSSGAKSRSTSESSWSLEIASANFSPRTWVGRGLVEMLCREEDVP